jgi:hypothetical protein
MVTKKKKTRPTKPKVSKKSRRKKTLPLYQANSSFPLFNELRALLLKSSVESFPDLEKQLRRMQSVKLAVVTGVFLNLESSQVDLLVVGTNVKVTQITDVIKKVESTLGHEVRYVILGDQEFKYRHEMHDRFLRDFFEYPHQIVINRIRFNI